MPALEPVARAAREEIEAGRALVSAVTAAELLVGASGEAGLERLSLFLDALPVVAADRDVATWAGRMGAHARTRGSSIPLPDLLIAATSVRLDVPLLTCDKDFARGQGTATPKSRSRKASGPAAESDGGSLWRRLVLHPASVPRA